MIYKWSTNEFGNLVAPGDGNTSLAVFYAESSPSRVRWQVSDRCSDFYLDGDADDVEQGKRRAEFCRRLFVSLDNGERYGLPDGITQAAAIAFVEHVA